MVASLLNLFFYISSTINSYFLIAGNSCGLMPDKQRIPPGIVKLHSVAASMLRGPCIGSGSGSGLGLGL